MARRRRQDIEGDCGFRVEGDAALPGERQAPGLANLGDERFGGVGVDRLRLVPAEAEDDRLVGRMALAGEGERAEQRDGDGLHPIDRVLLREAGGEGRGGLHRPDSMGRRRPDADLEELEDADHRFVPARQALPMV